MLGKVDVSMLSGSSEMICGMLEIVCDDDTNCCATGDEEGAISVGTVGNGTGRAPLMVPAPSGRGFWRELVKTGRTAAPGAMGVIVVETGGRVIVIGDAACIGF